MIHDLSDLFTIVQGMLLWKPIFDANWRKLHTPPSFCALAFQNDNYIQRAHARKISCTTVLFIARRNSAK